MATLEKTLKPASGYPLAFLISILIIGGTWAAIALSNPIYLLALLLGLILAPGLFFITPNNSRVLILFGNYKGTVKEHGFYWVNPFYIKKPISLRAHNFDSERVKVNDKVGNPILIGVILVWRVRDTFKASFEVDNFVEFVRIQSDAAVRKLAGKYPYDNFEDDEAEVTLRSGLDEVNVTLEHELTDRLAMAGIEVIEARIGYLAYASEIASAMLQRQQASAIVAARHKIVEGAVSMVEMALDQLNEKEIVTLDEEKKAAMVSNLMVVLCSDKSASPVLNTGTLNH
jgi:regulator of protease activity HflC (stomatin/prohibitin superfamily)